MELNSKTINFLLEKERLKSFVNDEKITDVYFDFFAKKYCEKLQEIIGDFKEDFKEDFLIEDAITAGIYFGFYFDNFRFWIPEKKEELVSFIEAHKLSFLRVTKEFLLSVMRASDVEDVFVIKDEILKELLFFCESNGINNETADNSFLTVLFYAFLLGTSQGRSVTIPIPKKERL